tara:strand:- start:82 stop:1467 length:1386 start_codon:yes stop_codon:yes gene_type:complete
MVLKRTKKGKHLIKNKKSKALKIIKEGMFSKKYLYNFKKLPDNGVSGENITHILDNRLSNINDKVSGCVYTKDPNCIRLLQNINSKYLFSNPLHPDLFPELIKMESEIISMVGSLFDLPENGGGNLTTGGTESTILALKAYKKIKKKSLYFFKPEVLCTKTVHAAVNKACELLDLNIVYVDLDENHVMDVNDLMSKISFKTCVVVASAPCFPYGLMDPINDISYLCEQYKIPLHVDACLGGFITQFDNSLRLSFNSNIQSLSVDPHKFGYAPKGSSILLWKNREMKHNQYFIQNDWTGGIYASVSLPGSRVGSQIATTWGALLYYGLSIYDCIGKQIIEETKLLANKIRSIDTFEVIGHPNVNVVAFYSNKYSVSQIVDYVSKEGWNLNILQNPLCVHLCITPKNIKCIENLVQLLRDICKEEVNNDGENIASIYGMSASLPDKSIVNEIVENYLDMTTNV